MDSNENNGLITKIWGPGMWKGLHSVAYGYPIKPTEEQKLNYLKYFQLVGDVLPCKYCRESYKKFISDGSTKLDMSVMDSRETLTRWVYMLHEAVNKKLGVNYGVSYDDVTKRYESYRASCGKPKVPKEPVKGCLMPLDDKAQSFKIHEYKDCPLIPLKLAKQFIQYAKIRNLPKDDFKIIEKCLSGTDITKKIGDYNCVDWEARNKECSLIISQMRIDGVDSLEMDGPHAGLPTVDELRLILRLCTNLTPSQLSDIIKKLPGNKSLKKVYKLIN